MDKPNRILGFVENNEFYRLPEKHATMLTAIQAQASVSPESEKIDLSEYEGKSLLVEFQVDGGNTIYGSEIIETGGEIITHLLKNLHFK